MKILFGMPTITKGKGGAERVCAELSNEMIARGHEVGILAFAENGETSSYELHPDVKLICTPFARVGDIKNVQKEIQTYDPDLYFYFYFDRLLIAQYAITQGLNIPLGGQECTNPHRMIRNLTKAPWIKTPEQAYHARRSILSGLHGIRFTLDGYKNSLPWVVQPQCHTFVNTFKPGKLADFHSISEPGRKRIINIGGLKSPNKNGNLLAQAFASIADQFPDWELHFFGGGKANTLERIAKQNNLQDRLIARGMSSDIDGEFMRSEIHAIPSLEEGCPNSVCEAMYHGVPSIGLDTCPGTNELIKHDYNGLLADGENQKASFAEQLAKLMSDSEMRKTFGQNAYDEAVVRFDQKTIYDQWEKLLKKIASYKKAPEKLFAEQQKINANQARQLDFSKRKLFSQISGTFFIRGLQEQDADLARLDKIQFNDEEYLPLLSVVVPIFNKKKYLQTTFKSIENLNYANKEILLVDDCSTDESLAECEAFARTGSHIKVIKRKKNGGLSAARNSGLAKAKGDYILFWDADDVLAPDGVKEITMEIMEDNSDIGTGLATRNGTILPHYKTTDILVRNLPFVAGQSTLKTTSTCFKVYKRAFLKQHNLTFVSGLYMQDAEFNYRAFALANGITTTDAIIGEYVAADDSWGATVTAPRLESIFEIDRLTREFTEKHGFESLEVFRQKYVLKFVFQFFIRRFCSRFVRKDEFNNIGKLYDEYGDRVREALYGLEDGILALALEEPKIGMGILVFRAGDTNKALNFFRGDRNQNFDLSKIIVPNSRISFAHVKSISEAFYANRH
jgi:glycosyltransferase involved in cell wall biosynthesis